MCAVREGVPLMRRWVSAAWIVLGCGAGLAIALPGSAESPGGSRRPEVVPAAVALRGAICPPGSKLRYQGGGDGASEPADFGKTFFGHYCTGCHGSALVGASRSGAPDELNWDDPNRIREKRSWIEAAAARGRQEHYDMPPPGTPVQPTRAERELLARWIACGAP